jgi:hypothetical protein
MKRIVDKEIINKTIDVCVPSSEMRSYLKAKTWTDYELVELIFGSPIKLEDKLFSRPTGLFGGRNQRRKPCAVRLVRRTGRRRHSSNSGRGTTENYGRCDIANGKSIKKKNKSL